MKRFDITTSTKWHFERADQLFAGSLIRALANRRPQPPHHDTAATFSSVRTNVDCYEDVQLIIIFAPPRLHGFCADLFSVSFRLFPLYSGEVGSVFLEALISLGNLVPEVRIELTTYPLPRGCATTTLLRPMAGSGVPPSAEPIAQGSGEGKSG